MGKKGGKKVKVDKAIENAEPNLAATPEEPLEKTPQDHVEEDATEITEMDMERRKSKMQRRRSTKKSIVADIRKQSMAASPEEQSKDPLISGDAETSMKSEPEEGDVKEVTKSKKRKSQSPGVTADEEKPSKKSKKTKKEKSEDEEAPKKKKGKKEKQEISMDEENVAVTTSAEVAEKKSKKKGDKGKKEKEESEGDTSKEKKGKKKKGATDEKVVTIETVDKEVQGVERKSVAETKARKSIMAPSQELLGKAGRPSVSKPERSKVSIVEEPLIAEAESKTKKGKRGKSSAKEKIARLSEDYSDASDRPRTSSVIRTSIFRRGSEPEAERRKSRGSQISSESSVETAEYEEGLAGRRKSSKAKKGKKAKKVAEAVELTEEERERRKAEKEAEKKAKKEAKKEAKKAAKAAKLEAQKAAEKKAKPGKPGELDYDEVKKQLDDLKSVAKELGVDLTKLETEKGDEKGPKKKITKKEKAKMTAEMAEKAKAEMEAQAKMLEEMIKKKREEDRLAAIEKDKRETVEQGLRIEQLQVTAGLIKNIAAANAEITKEEKELLEWKKYLECGKLPNPAVCAQMNTYLHLWDLDLEKTSIDEASVRTADGIKLLSDLDELIDTAAEEDQPKLENWKWIRQLFRDFQADSLDVATYRLLRNVEHNLNRINIPTANFNFKDDHVTLCLWLRVMLPIPLPNPRRPPKPRIDITFNLMDFSVLFPLTVDCENAAIRGMYLKYDHLSDLSETFYMPEVPKDFYMDLLAIVKKEWKTQLKYKYDNRDKTYKPAPEPLKDGGEPNFQTGVGAELSIKQSGESQEGEKRIKFEDTDQPEIDSDEQIPAVPFKQLKPTASEFALTVEDQLYSETRAKLKIQIPENVINLRKYVVLGGVFVLNFLAQPPQPQDFVTMEMTITGLSLPKKLEVLPFKVVYTPYVPPEPEPATGSDTSIRKLPEELEEEMKKQEEELDKLIFINVKWPPNVIFLELPIICRWDEDKKLWSNEEIYDVKHNEDKCMVSFRTGVFGVYGLATCRYSNLPFQAYDIKPEVDESVTVQLTAAILMLEFNVKDGLIAITQLQNSPNMTLQNSVGKYMKLHRLKRMMKEGGIDIFPAFDSFCYIDGCCEKHWAMEQHLYYNMAQISNSFNFSWSRWNLTAGRRKIVMQMREYLPDKGKQKNHQLLLVTPLKAAFIDCTEVSQAFSEKEIDTPKFAADLFHLMKTTSGIFVRNKVSKASKQNVFTLAQFLISIRVLSFS